MYANTRACTWARIWDGRGFSDRHSGRDRTNKNYWPIRIFVLLPTRHDEYGPSRMEGALLSRRHRHVLVDDVIDTPRTNEHANRLPNRVGHVRANAW